jgi:hypothetical protein
VRCCELLYAVFGRLACRRCHRLGHHTENMNRTCRDTERQFRLRRRLGQEPDSTFDAWPERPKGMHATTYARLLDQLAKVEDQASAGLSIVAARLMARCGASR